MSLDRHIVITGPMQAEAAARLIANNWAGMQNAGHPMAVHLCEHKERRNLEQNALMWLRLQEISDQAWIGGRQYSPDVWAEQMKREYLPEEEGPTKRCRKGYRKWDYTPDGERVLVGSTTQLTTAGFAEYMEQLEAYAASELGVRFSANPRKFAA